MKNRKFLLAFFALSLALFMQAGNGQEIVSAEELSNTEAKTTVSAETAEPISQTKEDISFTAVVEIPAGSNIKYETDSTGNIVVDRFMSMSVTYPANYGSVKDTIAEDNDPLDVLILTRDPLNPGSSIECRPIGYLNMIDGGDKDNKLIAVPVSSVDAAYDAIQDIQDLPDMELNRIADFFDTYKLLSKKAVVTNGYGNSVGAAELLQKAQAAYTAPAETEKVNMNNYTQTENVPEEINVVVEIPAGSNIKYEMDSMGNIIADRFLSTSVVYPANYGSAVSTLAADGDPLDVLVFTRTPVYPGAVITCRPIGYLDMKDDGEADSKIIAVPVDDVDATYSDIKNIEDLPEIERQRVEKFFANYKNLPAGKNKVELSGYKDSDAAKKLISEAAASFKPSDEKVVNLNDYPQNETSDALNVVIEIPQETSVKYEMNKEGDIEVDRFMSMSVVYPANYGFIPQTTATDGDPLDVLVYTREALIPGSIVAVRPIGMLRMNDGGDADDKIIAVPISNVDPTYENIKTIEDLPKIECQRLEKFFDVYKILQNKKVVTSGYAGVEAARTTVEAALNK